MIPTWGVHISVRIENSIKLGPKNQTWFDIWA